jgi:hypothetical protein
MQTGEKLSERPKGLFVAHALAPGTDGWGFTLLVNTETSEQFIKKSRLSPSRGYEAEYFACANLRGQ